MKSTLLLSALVVLGAMVTGCDKHTAAGKSGATALSVYKPMNETIKPGEKGEVDVRINRDNFEGAVTVVVTDLPTGIRLTNSTMIIPRDESKITLALSADPTAAPVKEHVVNVKASGPNGEVVQESFKITVGD